MARGSCALCSRAPSLVIRKKWGGAFLGVFVRVSRRMQNTRQTADFEPLKNLYGARRTRHQKNIKYCFCIFFPLFFRVRNNAKHPENIPKIKSQFTFFLAGRIEKMCFPTISGLLSLTRLQRTKRHRNRSNTRKLPEKLTSGMEDFGWRVAAAELKPLAAARPAGCKDATSILILIDTQITWVLTSWVCFASNTRIGIRVIRKHVLHTTPSTYKMRRQAHTAHNETQC